MRYKWWYYLSAWCVYVNAYWEYVHWEENKLQINVTVYLVTCSYFNINVVTNSMSMWTDNTQTYPLCHELLFSVAERIPRTAFCPEFCWVELFLIYPSEGLRLEYCNVFQNYSHYVYRSLLKQGRPSGLRTNIDLTPLLLIGPVPS